jgi:hypothetical protein
VYLARAFRTLEAERTLATTGASVLTIDDVRDLVVELLDIAGALREAAPSLKAKVYADLGIQLTFKPHERVVAVEAAPTVCQRACRRGDLSAGATQSGSRARCRSRRKKLGEIDIYVANVFFPPL